MTTLYTAEAIATGGRTGSVRSSEAHVVCPYSHLTRNGADVALSVS